MKSWDRLIKIVFTGNLIVQIGIVVTGGAVRLTGSGLGCPTWPDCTSGKISPIAHPATGYHSWIEFANRLLTFLLVIFAIAVLIVLFSPIIKKSQIANSKKELRTLRLLGATQIIGIMAQIVVGGVSVLTKLNPAVVGLHFLISLPIVAAALSLLRKIQREVLVSNTFQPTKLEQSLISNLLRVMTGLTFLVISVGTVVTGSGPHSGDTKAPRYHFSARNISWLHADLVIALISLTIGLILIFRVVKTIPNSQTLAIAAQKLLGACLLQGVIGYIQFFSHLPIVLVAAHILGSILVWLSMWDIAISTRVFVKRDK